MKVKKKWTDYWDENEVEGKKEGNEVDKNCTDFGVYFRDIFMLKNVGQWEDTILGSKWK